MNDEIRKNFVDVVQAAEEIQSFTYEMDFKAYQESPLTQRAVERDFEIIGGALSRIKKIDEEIIERISEHQRIIGFRNVLIHGYDLIDNMIVWNAVENHLPLLLKEAREILVV